MSPARWAFVAERLPALASTLGLPLAAFAARDREIAFAGPLTASLDDAGEALAGGFDATIGGTVAAFASLAIVAALGGGSRSSRSWRGESRYRRIHARGARARDVGFACQKRPVLTRRTRCTETGINAIAGRSGAGKFALASLLAGLRLAGSGRVATGCVDARSFSRSARAGRDFGFKTPRRRRPPGSGKPRVFSSRTARSPNAGRGTHADSLEGSGEYARLRDA